MKKIIFTGISCLLFHIFVRSQSVGIGTDAPNSSAMLEIKSHDKGLLIPRTSSTTRATITAAKGLIIYDSTVNSFWFHNGSNWSEISNANNVWGLTGNYSVVDGTNFIGTTANVPLSFRQNNVSIGRLDAGQNNVFFGDLAGGSTEAVNNTMIGDHAGVSIFGIGIGHNTFIGSQAGYSNTTATENTNVGSSAGYSNVLSSGNTMVGKDAGYTNTAGNNTFVGHKAGSLNTTGAENVFVGKDAGLSNGNASGNVFVGKDAGRLNTIGHHNTAYGLDALSANTTGDQNVAIGVAALGNSATGNNLVAIGDSALYAQQTDVQNYQGNTAIGSRALRANTTGYYSTATGYRSLMYSNGFSNTANGAWTLYNNTSGDENTAIGAQALNDNTTGNSNTAVGNDALFFNTTGGANTALGDRAFFSGTAYVYSTALGAGSNVSASYQIRLGTGNTMSIGGMVGWTNLSDSRFKTNVTENIPGLDFIMRLRPVAYHMDLDVLAAFLKTPASHRNKDHDRAKEQMLQTGFIAQEVEQAAKESGFDFSGVDKPKNPGDYYGLRYAEFVVPLVKAMQEQQKIIEKQSASIEELKKENAAIREQLKKIVGQ